VNVITGRDNAGLVDASIKLNDDFARSVVVDLLEFTDITLFNKH
jgi:hypothetical protein